MLPFFGQYLADLFLPPGVNADVQVFQYTAPAASQWQQWRKPKGCSMVFMLLISPGSGGGGGATGATTTARGGGGGGCNGDQAIHIFPAYFLPDVLWVAIRNGGAGGTAGNAGTAAGTTAIATAFGLTAGTTIPNVIASSGAAGGSGAGGTNSGNAAGGIAQAAGTKAGQGWAQAFSLSTFTQMIAGSTGGIATGAAGTDQTAGWNTIPTTSGAGGAGVNTVNTGFAGGAVSLQAFLDFPEGSFTPATTFLAGGTAGSNVLVGGDGQHGISSLRPLLFTGGSGGGSADGQIGGRGGDGGIGCGGGGGGGGTTGGRGGDGGPGLAILISW